jgi:hypothetical protein
LLPLALHHTPIANENEFLHLELLFDDLDLIGYRRRIASVALEHPHRQGLAFGAG